MSGTEEQKNPTSAESEQASGGTKGTSKDKGKLFTEAQIHQIKTSAGGEAGRLRQAAERERDALKEQVQSVTKRLSSLESEVNEARLAEARGDPESMRTYQRELAITKRERTAEDRDGDLLRREATLKTDRETIDVDKGKVAVAVLAAEHGLEVADLESLGITDYETLEKVAAKLAASKPKPKGEGEEEEEEQEFDTGETTGGKGTLDALSKANEDFSKGLITEKQLEEVASKVK